MNKFPKRSRRSTRHNTNGDIYNGFDPDEQLTPRQVCSYAAQRGVRINTNILALHRRDGVGPKYLVVNGRWIRYTPQLLEPFLKARETCEIDPANKFAAA